MYCQIPIRFFSTPYLQTEVLAMQILQNRLNIRAVCLAIDMQETLYNN